MAPVIELPQPLVDELARIADARGESLADFVASTLRLQLPELRASAERDIVPSGPEAFDVDLARRRHEVAALWARAAVCTGKNVALDWPLDRLNEIARIPPWNFVTPNARGLAVAIDLCEENGVALQDELPPLTNIPGPGDVLSALQPRRCELVVEFRVYGRVPMTGDLDCAAFGDTSQVTLVAGSNPIFEDAYSPELVAVRVHVAISEYESKVRQLPFNNDDAIDVSAEWTIARNALEHVLNVLRIMQVRIVQSDYRASHGVPFRSWVEIVFADNTGRRTENTRYEWRGEFLAHPAVVASPLQISPTLFADCYDTASEIALFGNSAMLSGFDAMRRLVLIIESTHSKPEDGIPKKGMSELEAAWREPPFQTRLRRLRQTGEPSIVSFPDDLALAAELAALRHEVCHLQLRDIRNSKIKARAEQSQIGITLYDQDLVARVQRALPVAMALARQILSDLVPHRFDPVRSRRATLHELLKLRRKTNYVLAPVASEILERTALARWYEGERHTEMATLVVELLDSPATASLAKSFIQVAIALPDTHDALFAAIQRNDMDFAEHAMLVIGIEDAKLVPLLRSRLVAAQRADLFSILDRVAPMISVSDPLQ